MSPVSRPFATDDVPDERFGIQSVEVAASILTAMSGSIGSQALKDIARSAGMSTGKVHRYLVSLVRTGLAIQEPDGRYAIGPLSIALGLAGLRSLSPVKIAPEFLRALRDEIGETSALMLWSERGPVVVDIEESTRPIFMNIRTGSLLPINQSASGHAFAAFLPAETTVNVDGKLKELRQAFGKGWSLDIPKVRRQRYASVRGLLVPGIAAMAAPVFDHRGNICATLAFLAREDDLAGEREHRAMEILTDNAERFSIRLGFVNEKSD